MYHIQHWLLFLFLLNIIIFFLYIIIVVLLFIIVFLHNLKTENSLVLITIFVHKTKIRNLRNYTKLSLTVDLMKIQYIKYSINEKEQMNFVIYLIKIN